MKIRPLFLLATILALSSVGFSLLSRVDSFMSVPSMIVLAAIDFSLIMYFFNGLRRAEILASSNIVNFVSGTIILLFCLIGALLG